MSPEGSFGIPRGWLERPIKISLIGVGGTGSQVADRLASLQVTLERLGSPGFEVTVFDGDVVSDANIGRQRFTRADVGRPKVDVLVHRINLFYGLDWEAVPAEWGAGDSQGQLTIGCVDSVATRMTIAKKRRGLWLDCGNDDRRGHVILGHLGNVRDSEAAKLPNWADLWGDVSEDAQETPSCSLEQAVARQSWPVNTMAAQIAGDLLWSLLRHGRIDWHGALFEVSPPTITRMAIDPATWAPFGYVSKSATVG